MKKLIGLTLALLALGGCATVRTPAVGLLYIETQSGITATSNQAGSRLGVSCLFSYMGLFATGDASIESARRNGGITLISSVDETTTSYLGLWAKYCIVVRGR